MYIYILKRGNNTTLYLQIKSIITSFHKVSIYTVLLWENVTCDLYTTQPK